MRWVNETTNHVLWYEQQFSLDDPSTTQTEALSPEALKKRSVQLAFESLLESFDADVYQTQKFQAQLQSTASFQHPDFLTFFVIWRDQHGYGLTEVNRLLEVIRYGQASLQGKLHIPLTLDDIEHLWIVHGLEKHFSCKDLGEDLDKIKWELSHHSPEIWSHFFQHVKGLASASTLLDLLVFIREYEVAADILLKLISQPITLDSLRDRLVGPIIWKAIPLDFSHNQRIAYQLTRMVKQGWALSSVLELVKIATEKVTDSSEAYWFLLALEVVVDYRLTEKDSDIKGVGVKKILFETPLKQWVYWVGKLSILLRFSSVNPQDTLPEDEKAVALLNEVLTRNKDNPVIVKQLTDQADEMFLAAREKHGITSSVFLTDKLIQTWTAEDIQQWCKAQEAEDKVIKLSEKLAVLKQAVFLAHGYEARPIQLVAVGLLYTSEKGVLAEINTGEGKSIIAAMLAVLKALEINYRIKEQKGNIVKIVRPVVDIVTSSAVLAQRDAEEQASFYHLFGLTAAHNIERAPIKPCYSKDIVYGDVLNFVADILDRDERRTPLRGDRPLDVVVVDEVDNMFVDQASYVTMLTRGIPGFTYLEPILVALWKQFEQIENHLAYDVGLKSWVWIEGEFRYEKGRVKLLGEESNAYIVEDRNGKIKELLRNYLAKLIGAEPPLLHVPTALKSFVTSQQENWINGLLTASSYVEGRNYVVSKDENGRPAILTVDYQNTGVVQQNMQWSDGVHQFLQIKHSFPLKAENVMTRFLSNMAFFRNYQGGMYGMTGTLGAEDERQFINEMYGVDFLRVPTYRPKRFLEVPPIVVDGKEEWKNAIWLVIDKEFNRDRAVLVVVETIKEVDEIEAHLKQYEWLASKVKAYSRNDLPGQGRHEPVDVGDIIIATNLAVRGTDLKTTEALEENGGLHVCIGYLPKNMRVQWQAYGRTARQGNRGTGQLVIDRQEAIRYLHFWYPWYQPGESVEDLLQWRDLAEADRLLRDRYFRKELAEIKDELHAKFFTYAESVFQNATDPLEVRQDVQQMEDLWGMWLRRKDPEISYFDGRRLQAEDQAYFKEKNAAIRKKANQDLDSLIAEINKDYQEQKLIRNPGYLAHKATYILFNQGNAGKAISHLDKALMLDPIYSLGASYLKGRAIVMRDNAAKQEAYDSLYRAKVQIHQWLIPQLESMLAIVNLHAIERNDSPLSKQTLSKIEVLKKIDSFIDSAMKVIVESDSEELIKVKAATLLKDVMGWDESHEPEIIEFREEGIIYLFELNAYKEEKDWFGTIASFVLGIVQIALGVVMSAVTPAVSASLIAGGIGDIIASTKSVVTGQPIDFDQYLSGKGIEYAVNILIAGATSVKESLTGKQLGAKAATEEVSKQATKEITTGVMGEVKKQLIERGLATAISYGVELAAGKTLERYEEDIRVSVSKGIERLEVEVPEAFKRVFFYDTAVNAAEKENRIRNHAIQLLRSYRDRYYTAASRIIRGVAQGLAAKAHRYGGYVLQVAEMGHSIARISEVTDDFVGDFRNYLRQETASYPTPEELLAINVRNQSPDQATADELMDQLKTQGFIVDQHIVNAEQIANQHFPDRSETEVAFIRRLCVAIEIADKADKREKINVFKAMLTEQVTHSIMAMIKGEVLSPLSAIAGTLASEKILEKMQEVQQDMRAQQKEGLASRPLRKVEGVVESSGDPIPSAPVTSSKNDPLFEDSSPAEESPPFTYKRYLENQAAIRKLFGPAEDSPPLGQLGGFGDVDLLSRVLNKKLYVYKDGVYEASFSGNELNVDGEIRLNYDSFDKKWGSVLSPYQKEGEYKWGSLYEVLAVGSGNTARELRAFTAKYLEAHPGETHAFLRTYNFEYELDKDKADLSSAKKSKTNKPKQGKTARGQPEDIVKPSGPPILAPSLKPLRDTLPMAHPPHVVDEQEPYWQEPLVNSIKALGKAAEKLDEFNQYGKEKWPIAYEFAKQRDRLLGRVIDEAANLAHIGNEYIGKGVTWLGENVPSPLMLNPYLYLGWEIFQTTEKGQQFNDKLAEGRAYVGGKIAEKFTAVEDYMTEKFAPTKADLSRIYEQNSQNPDFLRGLATLEVIGKKTGKRAGQALEIGEFALTFTGIGGALKIPGQILGKETAKQITKGRTLIGEKINAKLDQIAQKQFEQFVAKGEVFTPYGKQKLDFSHLTKAERGIVGDIFGTEKVRQLLPKGSQKIGRAMHVGEKGIDDLYRVNRPDVDYLVIEYKFGQSKIKNTLDGLQTSDSWLLGEHTGFNRVLDSVGKDRRLATHIRKSIESERVEKWLVHTDERGLVSLKLLDKNGKVITKPEKVTRLLGEHNGKR